MDPATQEEAILDIVTAIYNSQHIPESHKNSYIDHIQKYGMTEKMADELEKFFIEEAAAIDAEMSKKQELVEGLEKTKQLEQSENDELQAEIIAAIDQYGEEAKQEAKQDLQEIERAFEEVGEEIKEEGESEQIASIESKLKNK